MVILWNPDNTVSITHVLLKDRGRFVRIKSMQLGFSAFLNHVSCLMRLFRQYELQNVFMVSSSTQALKSPRSMLLSYFVKTVSNDLLIGSRCLIILFLCGLYEQSKSHFLLIFRISLDKR